MGYESKLFIVDKHRKVGSLVHDVWMIYGEKICEFNLSKIPGLSIIKNYPDTDCYIYADDGNHEVTEDLYGKNLKEIPLKDMISILEKLAEEDQWKYRRFKPCINLLKGFDPTQWENLVVLHYGY